MLFVYYSSAFNMILPTKLFDMLKQLGVNHSLCHWILDFLQRRTQAVKINNKLSETWCINTGAPQSYVLSPLLYSLYTNDCISHCDSAVCHVCHQEMFKFPDETVVGLISSDNLSLVDRCCRYNLELNVSKTKELSHH